MRVTRLLFSRPAIALAVTAVCCSQGSTPAIAATSDDIDRADAVIRCTQIHKEQFCTELGFIDIKRGSIAWRSHLDTMMTTATSDTGDGSFNELVDILEQLPRNKLAERQDQQISSAKSSIIKVELFESLASDPNRELESTRENPDTPQSAAANLAAHGAGSATEVVNASIPPSSFIMAGKLTQQERSYWCGPAVMQMIDWGDPGDDGIRDSQSTWASLLGTTSGAGTAISELVSEINSSTTWDSTAGKYATISVAGNTEYWFRSVHRAQLELYESPIVEHVQLRREYFPYLNFNHGGHYQVGRGYTEYGDLISIFDPYDERDFRSDGASSGGVHSLPVGSLFNATLANINQNIGA